MADTPTCSGRQEGDLQPANHQSPSGQATDRLTLLPSSPSKDASKDLAYGFMERVRHIHAHFALRTNSAPRRWISSAPFARKRVSPFGTVHSQMILAPAATAD
jgi:hypothetical protein